MTLNCKIQLENFNTYFTGEYITGDVILDTSRELSIKEIYISLEGRANVEWQDLEAERKHGLIEYHMETFNNQETLLTAQQILLSNLILSPGEYNYHFEIKIPEAVPSSCLTKLSSIKYELSVVVHDAVNCEKVQRIPVKIVRLFNIASNKELMKPITREFAKTDWWWICGFKPFRASVTINASAFIPGDHIQYILEMNNPSKYFDVQNITVVLMQSIQYTAKFPKQCENRIYRSIAFNNHDKPCNHSSTHTLKHSLHIPETLTNTSIDQCPIMISYELNIFIEMGALQTNGNMSFPITIGTYCDLNDTPVDSYVSTKSEDVHCHVKEDALVLDNLNETKSLEFIV